MGKIRGLINNVVFHLIIILIKFVGLNIVVVHTSSDKKIVIGMTATIDKELADFTSVFSQAKTAEEYKKRKKE